MRTAIDHSEALEHGLALKLGGIGLAGVLGAEAPTEWEEWVHTMAPGHHTHEMSPRHVEFWEFIWSIELGQPSHPDSFIALWPRGGGKTTTAESSALALAARGKRKYAWYISETQDKADKNVENIGSLLEGTAVEAHYPRHASRKVGKYGTSRGWRRNRLRTAGGFTIDAVGLDTAARGLKVEEQRPDIIFLDDVDGKHDTLATTAKKIETITTSILPAGSHDCVVIFVQNLIIKDGVASRLADGRADFLANRKVSGPHPAIRGLKYEWREVAGEVRRAIITGGTPTWAGQDIAACQRIIERVGLTAFLKECQHLVKELAQGIVLSSFDPAANTQEWSNADIKLAIANKTLVPFAGIDYGLWRFAFILLARDRAGRVHVLDEYFSQRETLATRARDIHAILDGYGITDLPVYGDPANPTDSLEMNTALAKGWDSDGEEIKPKWRALAAIKDKGSRLTGPDRINDMYEARTLLVRKTMGHDHRWKLGRNAGSEGEEIMGSRFMYEQENWSFPDPLEGRSQDQNPDDHTADGADMMAAYRYAIMSHLTPATFDLPEPAVNPNYDKSFDEMARKIAEQYKLTSQR